MLLLTGIDYRTRLPAQERIGQTSASDADHHHGTAMEACEGTGSARLYTKPAKTLLT